MLQLTKPIALDPQGDTWSGIRGQSPKKTPRIKNRLPRVAQWSELDAVAAETEPAQPQVAVETETQNSLAKFVAIAVATVAVVSGLVFVVVFWWFIVMGMVSWDVQDLANVFRG